MTREQAIEWLKDYRKNTNDMLSQELEALDMAISALEQVTKVQELLEYGYLSCVHHDMRAWKFMKDLEKIVGEEEQVSEKMTKDQAINYLYSSGMSEDQVSLVRVALSMALDERRCGMTLNEAIKRYINNAEYERIHGSLQGCLACRLLTERLKELKQLRKKTRWISVCERLPEEYGEYLITWKNPKYPKTYIGICECEITDVYDHEHNRFEVEWLFDGYITTAYPDSKVIAWMPLPEPYKEEGAE